MQRVLWGILGLGMVFFAPWWAVLAVGVIGAVLWDWYVEMVILGALYDALFGLGLGIGPWYRAIMHTGIFAGVLLVIEFVKTRINVRL